MSDLLEKRMGLYNNELSVKLKDNSDLLMTKNFPHDVAYKKAKLYDWDLNFLEEVEIKFQYSQRYTINKDQVEYLVQFKPLYHPEQKYIRDDGVQQFGFFLDIPDDSKVIRRWLILGRNHTTQFIRYNVLECNWTFKYIVDGKVYEQLGVIRDRNNYNSGVWSDGFVTSVENQAMFIVPTNKDTMLIDYGMRFMLSDNKIHPLVYEVTKRIDTFPIGIQKITLSQDHYNEHTDNPELKICDYYSSTSSKENINPIIKDITITYNGTSPNLRIGGSSRILTGTIYDTDNNIVELDNYEWSFILNDIPTSLEELIELFNIEIEKNKIIVSAKRNFKLMGYILKVSLSYEDQQSTIIMEVTA